MLRPRRGGARSTAMSGRTGIAAVLWLGAALGGCQAATNAAEGVSGLAEKTAHSVEEATTDASITFAVKAALAKDDSVRSAEINVTTDKGVVTLRGTQP